MSNAPSLDKELAKIRANSKHLLALRKKIVDKGSLSEMDMKHLEKIRTEINKCRKEERFLSGRIKQLSKQYN